MTETASFKIDIHQRLGEFCTLRSRFDRRLFEYGPLFVLAQLVITELAIIVEVAYQRLAPHPQMISWSIYSPVYAGVLLTLFAESLAIRNFLKKIPETFRQLWDEGALAQSQSDEVTERLANFLDDFERNLNTRRRLWLGIPLAVLGLFFFWSTGHLPFVLGRWFDSSDWATRLVATLVNTLTLFVPAVLVGYAVGIGIWKSLVTALSVRRFSQTFSLVVKATHPDRAGGLRPLGDLMLAMAMILIVASLALSVLTVYAGRIAFVYTKIYSQVFLGLVILLSLIAFFLPLISTHERMIAEKKKLQPLRVEIAQRIAELENSTQTNIREMDARQRKEVFEEVASLTDLYRRTESIPTWPFDREIIVRFATPQAISLLSLIGIAEPIADAINTLTSTLIGR